MLTPTKDGKSADQDWVVHQHLLDGVRLQVLANVNELSKRRLRHSDRLALLGRTMAMVAHEVGTPLHSIAGHLELLSQELPGEVLRGSPERRLAVIRSQLTRVTASRAPLAA